METILLLIVIFFILQLINYFTRKYAHTNLSYSRYLSRYACFPGDKFVLTVQMINKKLLPLPFVEIVEKIPDDFEYEMPSKMEHTQGYSYHHNTMMFLPYQKITRRYTIMCSKRGRYYFDSIAVSVGDYLGLKTYSREYESPVEFLVYPPIIPLSSLIIDCRNPMGDVSVKRWIIDDPSIIMGIREYTQNDSFNRIHWASSAKTGQLMVKNFDFTSDRKVVVLLNIETSKPFWVKIDGNKIEAAVNIAAAISSELLNSGISAGMYTNGALGGFFSGEGNYIPPSCGDVHLQAILKLLARITYSIQQPFEEALSGIIQSLRTDCRYIIITPIITDEMAQLIGIMNGKTGVTVISLSTMNMDMLPKSVSIFTVKEGGIELEAV